MKVLFFFFFVLSKALDQLFSISIWMCLHSQLFLGLPSVVIGITPEKAIKLGVNDFVCEIFRQELNTELLPIAHLVVAGGMAGSCQVIATNPMEITKIQFQVSNISLFWPFIPPLQNGERFLISFRKL